MNNRNIWLSFKDVFIHIMFALAILANAMSLVYPTEGVFIVSMGIAIVSITITSGFSNIKTIKNPQLFFAIWCLVLLLLSFIPASTPRAQSNITLYFRWYLFAGVGSLLIVNYKYDFELLMKVLVLASLAMAPVILTSNYSRFSYDAGNDEWMMTIYAIVPLMIASIYYLFFGKKFWFKILSLANLVSYFPMFVLHASRGAVVTIVFAFFIFIIQKQLKKGISKKILIMEGVIMLVVLVLVFELFITYMQQLASIFDLRWLIKFVYEEDISNGRSPIYTMAFDGFKDSPIIGNGIASFADYAPDVYPHNFFLQMLYETGILMFLPITYLVYRSIMVIINKRKCAFDYRIITFLFIISVVQLLFSSFFWKRQQFWMLIWMMLFSLIEKKQIKNIKI